MLIAQKCAAVIPCLNEDAGIAALVRGIRVHLASVLVVDDGSSDDTAGQALSAGATVLQHERTQGKGAALQSGLSQARDLGSEWAIVLDGDGQHAPGDIPTFLAAASDSGARMVVGNRMGCAVKMPFLRRLVNRWMSNQLSVYCGRSLPDSQCGFRMIHLPSWARLRFRSTHFEIESELLVRFLHARMDVAFVSIETLYAGERSKIRPMRDTLRWFRWWSEIRRELAAPEPAHSDLSEVADLSAAPLK